MRSTDTKWQWIDFLGRDITAGTSGRRVLLGWIGSASVAVAIVLWSLLTLLEQVPSSSVGVSLLGLALTGFLAARAVTALYPGGFAGLVDEILGIESDADIGLSPLVDFMFANLALVRSRLFMLALADLIPILLLAIVAAILSRVSWELWGRTKDLALQISFIADLQRDLLGDQVKVEEMAREYEETLKDIRVDLAAPYVIPASVWKARGETPPGD